MARNEKWLLLFLVAFLLIPWLGETLFNTKGEPREAIVAVSMLKSGNWILPVSYGSDIPYKPPFLAWLIAIFSMIFNGGTVNEFMSRLPSALSAIAMIMAGYNWASKHSSAKVAFCMAMVTVTSFEVYRAAVACRVDMVLTACISIALYQMYEWRLKRSLARYLAIALLLSGAVLTKGPVGALLPCLAMGIFCLLRRDNFFNTVAWLLGVCLLSMILPAIWYFKAYQIGGDDFMQLALEENIGRLTGTMSYESHENPWYYNIITILTGMLPWTIFALFVAVKSLVSCSKHHKSINIKGAIEKISEPSSFALTIALVVLLFYTIPSSKRSVYLLPMYPMMAYGISLLLSRLSNKSSEKAFSYFMFWLAIVMPIAGICLQWFHPSKIVIERINLLGYLLAAVPLLAALYWWKQRFTDKRLFYMLLVVYSLFLSYAGAFQPMVLNGKTDLSSVGKVAKASKSVGQVYSYIGYDKLLRYYTINFYLNDELRSLEINNLPKEAEFSVIASPQDMEIVKNELSLYDCQSEVIDVRSCDTHRPIELAVFRRKFESN